MTRIQAIRAPAGILLAVAAAAFAAPAPATPAPAADSLAAGRSVLAQGEYRRAEEIARGVLRSLDSTRGADSLLIADALDLTGTAMWRLGLEYQPGLGEIARRALGIRERLLPGDDLRIAASLHLAGLAEGGTRLGRALLERALAIRERALGPAHPDVGMTLMALARCRLALGDYDAARPLAERSVAVIEKALGPESPELAWCLDALGNSLIEVGDRRRARPYLERALAIRIHAFGPEHLDVAHASRSLGWLRFRELEPDTALVLFQRGLAIREQVLGSNHPLVGYATYDLAHAQRELGIGGEGRPAYERAIGIARSAFGRESDLEGMALLGLGVMFNQNGEPDSAVPYLERALAMRQQVRGADHPVVGWPIYYLGESAYLSGRHAEATAQYERARAHWEKSLGADHPEVARCLRSLGHAARGLGEFERARTCFERSFTIYEKALGPDHLFTTSVQNDIAILASEMGDLETARSHLERIIGIDQARGGILRIASVPVLLANLASILVRSGDPGLARAHLERAIALNDSLSPGDSSAFVARMYSSLGATYRILGDRTRATALLEGSTARLERLLGPAHPTLTGALHNLADLRFESGSFAEALALYDRALEIRRRTSGPNHPATGGSQLARALTLRRVGRGAEALEAAVDADRIGRSHTQLIVRNLPERQALEHAARVRSRQSILLTLLEESGGRESESRVRVWDALIRSRGLVLDEVGAQRRSVGQATEVARLAQRYAAAQQRLANLMVGGPKQMSPAQHAELIRQVREESERLAGSLAAASTPFREERARSGAGPEEIRAALPRLGALVGYWRYEPGAADAPPGPAGEQPRPAGESAPGARYAAFVLTPGADRPDFVPLGSALEIDALVQRWRETLARDATSRDRARGESEALAAGIALHERVWDPVAGSLSGASRIFVVPDGALHLVNFAALPAGPGGFLAEGPAILHLLSAERDLAAFQSRGSAGGGYLVVGGPAFDARSRPVIAAGSPPKTGDAGREAGADSTTILASAAPYRSGRSTCAEFRSLRFGALPGTGHETAEVASLLKEAAGADVLQLSGAAATESALKHEAPGKRVLHLATHGFFLDENCGGEQAAGARGIGGFSPKTPGGKDPERRASNGDDAASSTAPRREESPLLLSGLALAGANQRDHAGPDEDDGILTAEEIAAMDLSGVEWAVLSACETGVGRTLPGEGVFGLRRAFQVAGARTLIMSLWPVEDESARQWMRTLYAAKFQRGLDTASAVRAATVELLQARRARGESVSPFYWGAFVAAGDWR